MRRVAAVVLAAGLTACAGRPVTLGDPLPPGATPDPGPPLAAKACGSQWLLLPPFAMTDRYERAYADLRTQAGGRALTDVTVDEQVIGLVVVAVMCAKLEARPAVAIADPPVGGRRIAFVAGGRARIAATATVRIRATPDAVPAPGLRAGDAVTLKAPMRNASGAWWYVTAAGRAGWVRETELEAAAPGPEG